MLSLCKWSERHEILYDRGTPLRRSIPKWGGQFPSLSQSTPSVVLGVHLLPAGWLEVSVKVKITVESFFERNRDLLYPLGQYYPFDINMANYTFDINMANIILSISTWPIILSLCNAYSEQQQILLRPNLQMSIFNSMIRRLCDAFSNSKTQGKN